MKKAAVIALALLCVLPALANTPGKHIVVLTWTPGACSGAPGSCTTNVYRGTSANVCSGQPSPYATGVQGATYTDLNPPPGAVYYNVSNVDPGKGGESTCDGEVQVSVQTITTQPHSGLSGTQQ